MAQAGSELFRYFLVVATVSTVVGIMWRAAGVSYLRYSNEMAGILRQCLREPYRTAALARDQTHVLEKVCEWCTAAEIHARRHQQGLRKGWRCRSQKVSLVIL